MLCNIPTELRHLPQWIGWSSFQETPDAKPVKKPINPHTGRLASPTDPSTWGTFEEACAAAPYCSGVGYVLADDPYFCIDLDDPYEILPCGTPKYSNPEAIAERQKRISDAFETYQEVSPSGSGLHIWGRGVVPSGRRREAVEIYSSGRYMTFTGQVYKALPIADYQDLLTILWEEMSQTEKVVSTCDKPQTQTDTEILTIASQAVNGQKFMDLFDGNWKDYYPSQSEADFCLANIIAFYTQNREQVIRIFESSVLGKRKKSMRDLRKYIIDRVFDNQPEAVDMDGLRNQLEEQLNEKKAVVVKEKKERKTVKEESNASQLSTESNTKQLSNRYTDKEFEYSVPPGLVGEIAQFVYSAAPRPVKEIAIAAAIGLMSGVCGRSYNVSGTGLNNYILILAMTGAGKESCATGIDKLMTATIKTVPDASKFIGPGEIASPQALMKFMSHSSNCFMSLVGEFGMKFKQLCDIRASSNEIGLKRIFLDLYNKSGASSILKPLIYSDKDKNTEPIQSPAFSMLGETTPEVFYENLNSTLISDGLLPRFTIIEYKGNRPQLNKKHLNVVPDTSLLDKFSALCAYSLQLNNGNNVLPVQVESNALQLFENFDAHCDYQINTASNDVTRQLWNRAHIKGLKLAALLAVGVNYINPVVDVECATWALNLITNDVQNLLTRFDAGTIGASNLQNDQTTDIKRAIKKYITSPWEELATSNGATLATWSIKVIPHSYISTFCRQRSSFKNDKLGPIQALKTCIGAMIDTDELRELSPQDKRQKGLAINSRAYMLTNLNSV